MLGNKGFSGKIEPTRNDGQGYKQLRRKLSQLYYLNKERTELNEQLEQLETLSTSVTSKLSSAPAHSGSSDKVGDVASMILDIKNLLNENLKKITEERLKLTKFITEIPDSDIRLIIKYRYVDLLSWNEIAHRLNERDEQYARRKHDRYLKRFCEENKNFL